MGPASRPIERCSDCSARERWAALTPHSANALEQLVRGRQWLEAAILLRELDATLGINDAMSLVWAEKRRLGISTSPPLESLDVLCERALSIQPPPVVIEAVWDGDTVHDWFVILVAVVPDPASPRGFSERHLATVTQSHGSPGQRASEIGRALAGRLGVPFCFSSPSDPDDAAPRWWDTR